MKTKKKTESQKLRQLLQKQDAIPKAIAALLRSLDATRSIAQNGQVRTEADFATQTKAAVALLTWSASPPPRANKDVEPPDKRSEAEKSAEIVRILGIE